MCTCMYECVCLCVYVVGGEVALGPEHSKPVFLIAYAYMSNGIQRVMQPKSNGKQRVMVPKTKIYRSGQAQNEGQECERGRTAFA